MHKLHVGLVWKLGVVVYLGADCLPGAPCDLKVTVPDEDHKVGIPGLHFDADDVKSAARLMVRGA